MTTIVVALRNFANASKKGVNPCWTLQYIDFFMFHTFPRILFTAFRKYIFVISLTLFQARQQDFYKQIHVTLQLNVTFWVRIRFEPVLELMTNLYSRYLTLRSRRSEESVGPPLVKELYEVSLFKFLMYSVYCFLPQ